MLERIGGYTLGEQVGLGANPSVYIARPDTGDPVLIKLPRPDQTVTEELLAWFRQEAEALRMLDDGPAAGMVPKLIECGVESGLPFLVMVRIEGRPLHEHDLPFHGPPLERLALALAEALAACHAAGVVHNDVKPANVVADSGGHAHLVDFGLATFRGAHSHPGVGEGSPPYMAPERVASGRAGTGAVDVWAWGCTVAEAGTGRRPFPGDAMELLLDGWPEPDLDDLPSALRAVVAVALDTDPERRPTAAQIVGQLRPLPGSHKRSRRAAVLGVLGVLAALLIVGALLLLRADDGRKGRVATPGSAGIDPMGTTSSVAPGVTTQLGPATTSGIGGISAAGGRTTTTSANAAIGGGPAPAAGFVGPTVTTGTSSPGPTAPGSTTTQPAPTNTVRPTTTTVVAPTTTTTTTPPPPLAPRAITIAQRFPAPGIPNGIAWDGGSLWVAENSSRLFQLGTSGQPLANYQSPEPTPQGITWDGSTFWLDTTNRGRVYHLQVGGGSVTTLGYFDNPAEFCCGSDLASDGSTLWYAYGFTVWHLDKSGNVIGSFTVLDRISGLDWDGSSLWLSSDSKRRIEQRTATGGLIASFTSPLASTAGLVWAGGTLWAIGQEAIGGAYEIFRLSVPA